MTWQAAPDLFPLGWRLALAIKDGTATAEDYRVAANEMTDLATNTRGLLVQHTRACQSRDCETARCLRDALGELELLQHWCESQRDTLRQVVTP